MLNVVDFIFRSFRPDFLLIRQHIRDAGDGDYRNLLLGFKYGGVPSVNSLHSLYNFQDKPWVVSSTFIIFKKLFLLKRFGTLKSPNFIIIFIIIHLKILQFLTN